MKKRTKPSEELQYAPEQIRDQYTMVLERIDSKIDLLIAGQNDLNERMEKLKTDAESNFRSLANYLVRIESGWQG